uniref:Uncharacterized protein n=1 Tax=Arundo donax TaxID=35708 RepID=A0A0A9FKL7_ARUDO
MNWDVIVSVICCKLGFYSIILFLKWAETFCCFHFSRFARLCVFRRCCFFISVACNINFPFVRLVSSFAVSIQLPLAFPLLFTSSGGELSRCLRQIIYFSKFLQYTCIFPAFIIFKYVYVFHIFILIFIMQI